MNALNFCMTTLLISGLLSACATAPQPPANQVETKVETKPELSQPTPKPAESAPKNGYAVYNHNAGVTIIKPHTLSIEERKAKIDSLFMHVCDAKTVWASAILRARTQGAPLDYMLKLLDSPELATSETRRTGYDLTMAIYRSKNPVHVVAEVRKNCLTGYGLK